MQPISRFRHLSRVLLKLLSAAALGLGAAAPAWARVPVEAPEALGRLIDQYLPFLDEQKPAALDAEARLRLLRRARREVADLLATEGYFEPRLEAVEDERGWRLVLTPGPRVQIGQVELVFEGELAGAGDERLRRRQDLEHAWKLPQGQPFRQADWDLAKQALLDDVASRDYAAARIAESHAAIDPATGQAALRVVLDSGPAYRFGELQARGLSDYPAELLQRYHPPVPGTPYRLDSLLRFQSALQSTPYFASVVADVVREGADPQAAPILVQVSEAKPRRVSLGLGASSNTGSRVEMGYRDANLWGSANNLVSGLRLEQRRQVGYTDLFLPPDRAGYQDSVGLLAEHTNISGLQTRRQALGLVRSIPTGIIENRYALSFQQELLAPEGSVETRRTALAANWSWTRRQVDDVLDPRDGQVLNFQLGGAARALLSDRNFVRLYGRYQGFWPVFRRDVLTLRAEVGINVAASRDGIPQDFLFRTGGAQTVRGYAYQSLGVKDGSAVVGGRYLAVTSAEYVHWFEGDWGLAAFVDAGNANDERKLFKLNLGYGIGPRWKSPAGPLALDLAYGQSEHRLRLQFAVAIAF